MRQIINTSDYQKIIDSLLPSEIHTLDRMLGAGNRIGWMNALERIAKLSKEEREERNNNVMGQLNSLTILKSPIIKDYKPKPISQDSINNNEWTFLQTASGAIAIIVISLIIIISNL